MLRIRSQALGTAGIQYQVGTDAQQVEVFESVTGDAPVVLFAGIDMPWADLVRALPALNALAAHPHLQALGERQEA